MAIKRSSFILLLILASSMLLSGCIRQMGTGNQMYVDQYKKDVLNRKPAYDPSQQADCKVGNCWCMVCINGTNFLRWPQKSLVGGRCYMEKDCNDTTYTDLTDPSKTKDRELWHFMLGQGPSFPDFAMSYPSCDNRSSMAVQWLVGGNETPYTLPSANRAECMLQKGIIPVYVLYSKGLNINETRTHEIARILATEGKDYLGLPVTGGHVGPVIIVTEIDFNQSNAGAVAAEVKAINQECNPNRKGGEVYCWVAVAPKMNDTAALEAVMQAAGPDNIDLVAYGVNGKYTSSCRGTDIRQQAVSWSAYVLYTYGKPTIIPYIMFDSTGTNADGSCQWDEQSMTNAYSSMAQGGPADLLDRGVLGMAPYLYAISQPGITNPLGCTDCALNKTTQRMQAWFSWCQKYAWYSAPQYSGEASPRASMGNYIRFANESGGPPCSWLSVNGDFMGGMPFQDNMGTKDMLNPVTPSLDPIGKELFSCDECLVKNDTYMTNPPFGLEGVLTDLKGKDGNWGAAPSKEYCTNYPEIDRWASARNLDPMLVRAFIFTESGFLPCAAAKVCSAECKSGGCSAPEKAECLGLGPSDGNDECYTNGYDTMIDPRTNPNDPGYSSPAKCDHFVRKGKGGITELTPGAAPALTVEEIKAGKTPLWRWCGLGIMQSVEPPYTFWPAAYTSDGQNGKYFYAFEQSGLWKNSLKAVQKDPDKEILLLVYARGCNENFNPFDASDSICMGTLKMESMLKYGKTWVEANGDKIGITPGSQEADIFAAYIAGNMYGGYWLSNTRSDAKGCTPGESNADCWLHGFIDSRKVSVPWCKENAGSERAKEVCSGDNPLNDPKEGKCYGYSDFITYVRGCWQKSGRMYNIDGGATKLAAYYWFQRGCENSFCPAEKKLAIAMERPVPGTGAASGTTGTTTPPTTTTTKTQ